MTGPPHDQLRRAILSIQSQVAYGHVGNSAAGDAGPLWEEGPFWTAIVGSAATTALGVAVLVPAPAEIVYLHEHNVLVPIVDGADPDRLYPTFIFRMLHLPRAAGDGSPREDLVAVFESLVEDAVPESERALARSIVFGPGGIHDARLLQLHQDLLEELGVPHDKKKLDIQAGDTKKPDFLKINPNGKVPTIVHDGVAIWESSAITMYLGETFGVEKKLWPAAGPRRGEAMKWVAWTNVTLGEAVYRRGYASGEWGPNHPKNEQAFAAASSPRFARCLAAQKLQMANAPSCEASPSVPSA